MATPTESAVQYQPLLPPPPLPPVTLVVEQAYTASTGHGAVGPVIGVLAVIGFLGLAAGMIGRLCTGRSVMGYGHFDVEGWMETKCSSCIDGHITPPRPPRTRPPPPPPDEVHVRSYSAEAHTAAGESCGPGEPPGATVAEVAEEEEEVEEEDDDGGEEEEHEKHKSHDDYRPQSCP